MAGLAAPQATGCSGRTRSARCASGLTLSDFFYRRFLATLEAQGKQAETHKSLYRNHIEPILGELLMASVTAQHVQAFAQQLRRKTVAAGRWKTQAGKTLSEGTVRRILILLRHIFNEARRQKVPGVVDNPTASLNLGGDSGVVKGQFLQPEQLRLAVKEALGHTQLKTTMKYSHLTDKARKQTEALVAQALCLA